MDLNRLWQGQRTSPMRNTESMHHCQILYYAGWSPPHNWRKFNTDESKSCPAPPRGTTGPPPPTLRVAEPGARVSSEDRLPTSADQRAPSTTMLSTGDPVRRTSHTETPKAVTPPRWIRTERRTPMREAPAVARRIMLWVQGLPPHLTLSHSDGRSQGASRGTSGRPSFLRSPHRARCPYLLSRTRAGVRPRARLPLALDGWVAEPEAWSTDAVARWGWSSEAPGSNDRTTRHWKPILSLKAEIHTRTYQEYSSMNYSATAANQEKLVMRSSHSSSELPWAYTVQTGVMPSSHSSSELQWAFARSDRSTARGRLQRGRGLLGCSCFVAV